MAAASRLEALEQRSLTVVYSRRMSVGRRDYMTLCKERM